MPKTQHPRGTYVMLYDLRSTNAYSDSILRNCINIYMSSRLVPSETFYDRVRLHSCFSEQNFRYCSSKSYIICIHKLAICAFTVSPRLLYDLGYRYNWPEGGEVGSQVLSFLPIYISIYMYTLYMYNAPSRRCRQETSSKSGPLRATNLW
jgi:hypothetical protein